MAKQRASYFTEIEQQVLLEAYEEERATINKKSNTLISAKARELARQRIADRVNACNPCSQERSWKQVKMKYKNIVQIANKKTAEARKTGGGTALPLTPVKELAVSVNRGRPMMEGIPGGTSSEPATSQEEHTPLVQFEGGVLLLVEHPPPVIDPVTAAVDDDEDRTLSGIEEPAPISTEVENQKDAEEPATSTNQYNNMSAKELYRVHLQRQIAKADLKMEYLKLKIEAMKKGTQSQHDK